MRIVQKTKISGWQDLPNSSQTFPGIAVTDTGRIIVSWRSAIKKEQVDGQYPLYSYSDDHGRTWSKPVNPFTAPAINGVQGNFRAMYPTFSNGKLWMHLCWVDCDVPGRPFFKEENSGLLDCKIFLSYSEDDGLSWSKPQQLDAGRYAAQPTPITGPLLVFPDGEIISQFELNNPYDSQEVWRHLPVLNFSRDSGKTFYRLAIPAEDPQNDIFYWDQRPLFLKDGNSIVNFYWTWDNAQNVYHNITTTISRDRGITWSAPHDTGVAGQAGQPVEFEDGTLLLPLVDRTGIPKIMARISHDQGQTFADETITLSNEICKKQTTQQDAVAGAWNEMTNFSLGLPAGCSSGHNTAYVVWYAGSHTDQTDIEFAEIEL